MSAMDRKQTLEERLFSPAPRLDQGRNKPFSYTPDPGPYPGPCVADQEIRHAGRARRGAVGGAGLPKYGE